MKHNNVWTILACTPIIIFLNDLYQISKVDGHSMRPTLNPSDLRTDWVLIKKWNFLSKLKINDIVLINSPTDPTISLCKRIKALEGDKILVPLGSKFGKMTQLKTMIVPRGHVWVQGDNLHSLDSRDFGTLSKGLIKGQIIKIIWPWNRFFSNLNEWVGVNIVDVENNVENNI